MHRTYRPFLSVIAALLFVANLQAADTPSPFRPVTEADRALLSRGPVIQNVTPSSAVFMGRPAEALLDEPVVVTVTAGDTVRTASGKHDPARNTFELAVDGLPSDTLCRYTIQVGTRQTEPFAFRTAPAGNGRTVTFVAYGDTRTRPEVHAAVAAAIFRQQPEFVTCGGDLVAAGNKPELWNPEFFEPARDYLAAAPVYPALGNHEQHSEHYFNLFALPEREAYYTMTWGPVRVITLDQYQAHEPGSDQYVWAEKVLARPFAGWTIVQIHEPPFGSHKKRTISLPVINTLVPLFEKHNVDLVLCGHDHYYLRNVPLAREKGGHAVQYVITGGGGAPLYESVPAPYIAKAESVAHYVVIRASIDRLDARVLTPEDRELDAFTLSRAAPAVAESWLALIWPALAGKEIQAALAGLKLDAQGRALLRLRNPGTSKATLSATWKTEGTAWTVRPDVTSLVLEPGATGSLTAVVQSPEAAGFYPAPALAITFAADGAPPVTVENALPLANRPVADAGRTAGPMTLDGRADEPDWKLADRLPIQWLSKGLPAPANKTDVRVLVASDALYAAFGCAENDMAGTKALATDKDPITAAADDCVEFFVMNPTEPKRGAQLIVSIKGVQYGSGFTWDGKSKTTSALTCEWQAVTTRSDDGWQAEIRVPWQTVGLTAAPAAGTTLTLNATRMEHNPKPGAAGEFVADHTQWAVTFGPNHAADKYGTVRVQ
jgi:hypothetical protein